jgi:hypothetical protein
MTLFNWGRVERDGKMMNAEGVSIWKEAAWPVRRCYPHIHTECHGQVISTPPLYSRGHRFKFWSGDRLSWHFPVVCSLLLWHAVVVGSMLSGHSVSLDYKWATSVIWWSAYIFIIEMVLVLVWTIGCNFLKCMWMCWFIAGVCCRGLSSLLLVLG